MTQLEAKALAWIRQALSEEVPGSDPRWIDEHARVLHQYCEDFGVPIEELVRWLHSEECDLGDTGGLATNWAHHAAWYAEFRKRHCVQTEGQSI